MRVRTLSSIGDYTFGQGTANFLIDTPITVGQEVETRLALMQGEWYLDLTAGCPWHTEILGYNTTATRDLAIKSVILGTQGVKALLSYVSNVDAVTRAFTVSAEILTVYGTTSITSTQILSTVS
jgi:hypothetical protein